jgi:hypothetical protein
LKPDEHYTVRIELNRTASFGGVPVQETVEHESMAVFSDNFVKPVQVYFELLDLLLWRSKEDAPG